MKDTFVQTRNVLGFTEAIKAVHKERGPKIILMKGAPGYGKTRTCAWLAVQEKTVYLEAEAGWNIGWFLDDLCFELGVKPEHKLSARSRQVRDIIRKEKPIVLIDEADLLRHDHRVLETIKSIHDRCDVPVVLIGTGEIDQVIRSYAQFCSRVFHTVEYRELDKEDIASVFGQLSEVAMDPGGLETLASHVKTMRDMVRWVIHIERAVKAGNKKLADAEIIKTVALKIPKSRVA